MSLRTTVSAVGAVLLTPACQHGPSPQHHGDGMHHRFNDAQSWAARFDAPDRDAWQQPDAVIRALALAPDAVVADVGSGTGYFAVRLARAVPSGTVYGADVEPDMVAYLRERAGKEALPNLISVQATADSPGLTTAVDLVLLVDTYHHLGNRPAYLRQLAGSLKPNARVAVIDFRRGQPMGPPDAHKLNPEEVEAEFREAGYALQQNHAFLPNQYFLVFARR